MSALRLRGTLITEALILQLSPLAWDHINLTGDYVWSDALALDADGTCPSSCRFHDGQGEAYRVLVADAVWLNCVSARAHDADRRRKWLMGMALKDEVGVLLPLNSRTGRLGLIGG